MEGPLVTLRADEEETVALAHELPTRNTGRANTANWVWCPQNSTRELHSSLEGGVILPPNVHTYEDVPESFHGYRPPVFDIDPARYFIVNAGPLDQKPTSMFLERLMSITSSYWLCSPS